MVDEFLTVSKLKKILKKQKKKTRVKILFESCIFDIKPEDIFLDKNGNLLISDGEWKEDYVAKKDTRQ